MGERLLMMPRWILVVISVACGCGGAEKPHVGPSLEPDTKAIEAAVRADVALQYEALADFDVDGWAEHLAPDAIVIGSGPDEVWIGRDAAAAAIHEHLDPARGAGASATSESKALEIGIAPDGHAAWMADEMDFLVSSHGQELRVPWRISEVIGERDGVWQVIVATFSVGVPAALAAERAASDDWPELAAIPPGIGSGADAVYTMAARDLDRVESLQGAMVFGATPDGRLGEVKIREHGELRAGVAPGGQLGWVIGNLDVAIGEGTQPYRLMLVYVRELGAWLVVHAHFSNGVPDA
jgi:hypothetical protein